MKKSTTTSIAIQALTTRAREIALNLAHTTAEASEAAGQHETNQVVGTLMAAETDLEALLQIITTIKTLNKVTP